MVCDRYSDTTGGGLYIPSVLMPPRQPAYRRQLDCIWTASVPPVWSRVMIRSMGCTIILRLWSKTIRTGSDLVTAYGQRVVAVDR